MISIKKNESLKLKIPKFICDDGINDRLNKYDMLSHFNKYCFSIILGKPQSGKTSLLISWLTSKHIFKKCFHHVLVIMPRSSIKSMKSNPFKDHPEDKMYDELTFESFEDIMKKLALSSEENESTLLIMDDVGASLRNKELQQMMRKLIFNRRHLKCAIIGLVQSYISFDPQIRKMVNNVIMFKPSKVEFEKLFDELFEKMDKRLALKVMEISYDDPHNYLMLNVDSQKMYKGFDEIIIKESNDEENNNLT
jgi:hypothetical protein